jgi:predicted phosphodiesterase
MTFPLITSDWHLDSDPDNEYRWAIVDKVLHAVIQHKIDTVFILGDLVDRPKDRPTAVFVNRLVNELRKIAARVHLIILRGNHDTPVRGPAFWEFLSQINNIRYVSKPETFHLFDNDKPDLLLLPFTPTPKQDWSDFKLSDFRALFMHATVTGAVTENGQVLENNNFPILPRKLKVYSGDIHTQQRAGVVTYCGAPHPVKHGDKYPCRMLLLNDNFDIEMELPLTTIRKLLIDITNVRQLADLKVTRGDQVKIRFNISAAQLAEWGAIERTINEWAANSGVTVIGTETIIDSVHSPRDIDTSLTPEALLRQFAEQEHLSEELIEVGLSLLAETQ